MSKLTSNFDVSYNSLTGHIPKIALQYLTDMKDNLKLNHNQFSGTIPSEIGLMTKMTVSSTLEMYCLTKFCFECRAKVVQSIAFSVLVSVHERTLCVDLAHHSFYMYA